MAMALDGAGTGAGNCTGTGICNGTWHGIRAGSSNATPTYMGAGRLARALAFHAPLTLAPALSQRDKVRREHRAKSDISSRTDC